jgi:membrane protein
MCLFLFSLIPHLPFIKKRVIKVQVSQLIKDIVPAKEHNANLIEFVNGFLDNSSTGLLSFGLILILFFASNGMMGIMRSFNKDYIGFEKRNGLQKRWNAIRLTILIMLLLFATLMLLILQGTVLSWLGIKDKSLLSFIGYIRWGFILALVFYSIAFIYKYAPSVKKKWDIVSPGALLATSLSILATILFSVFVNNFGKYNALYGSIGSVIVIMSIVFINSLALLIGYELNVSIHSLQHMAQQRVAAEKKELAIK